MGSFSTHSWRARPATILQKKSFSLPIQLMCTVPSCAVTARLQPWEHHSSHCLLSSRLHSLPLPRSSKVWCTHQLNMAICYRHQIFELLDNWGKRSRKIRRGVLTANLPRPGNSAARSLPGLFTLAWREACDWEIVGRDIRDTKETDVG